MFRNLTESISLHTKRYRLSPRMWSLLTSILAVIVAAVALVLLMRYLPTIEATSNNVPAGVHILYLRPKIEANVDIPKMDGEWASNGIKTVNSIEDLRRLADNQAVDTIMFHRDTAPQLNRKWLKKQYQSERAIVGINLTMTELSQAVRGIDPDPIWTDGWQGASFFSMMIQVSRPDRGGYFEFSNHLYSREYLLTTLEDALKLRKE